MAMNKANYRLHAYNRMADDLGSQIINGNLRPGDRVLSESQLCKKYCLSLGTVRKGMDLLVSEGLIERAQGRGTFVRQPSFDNSLFRFFQFLGKDKWFQIPEGRILVRKVRPIPSYAARALNVAEGQDAIYMKRLRLYEGAPVLFEKIWLALPRFEHFLKLEKNEIGDLLYPVYDKECGQLIARAEEELRAEAASRATAKHLEINKGAPVIVIERLARGYNGTALEWRRSCGRADQFRYRTEIR